VNGINTRNLLVAVSFWCFVAILAGCSKQESDTSASAESAPSGEPSTAADQAGEELGTADAVALAGEFAKQCSGDVVASRECTVLRSLLVVEVTFALEEIERSRDQRGTEEA
jgi:hypothetical protein